MDESKLNKQLEVYANLGKADKRIDVASLMISALNSHQINALSAKEKKWGYLVSITAPPVGLLFALKFWLSGKDDGHEAAWICITLTAVSLLLVVITTKLLLSGSGVTQNQFEQLQQVKPQDIRELYQ